MRSLSSHTHIAVSKAEKLKIYIGIHLRDAKYQKPAALDSNYFFFLLKAANIPSGNDSTQKAGPLCISACFSSSFQTKHFPYQKSKQTPHLGPGARHCTLEFVSRTGHNSHVHSPLGGSLHICFFTNRAAVSTACMTNVGVSFLDIHNRMSLNVCSNSECYVLEGGLNHIRTASMSWKHA